MCFDVSGKPQVLFNLSLCRLQYLAIRHADTLIGFNQPVAQRMLLLLRRIRNLAMTVFFVSIV
jgi:hypothetical protein